MNKKEVAEIKKLFKPEMCNLTRICGCYVDSEKQKVSETKEAFLSIPEEEMFKYFDVFKKNLSGKIGKNLLNLKYETSTYLPGQDLLLGLKDSKLTDNSLIEELFDKIISSYYYVGNYYIHCSPCYCHPSTPYISTFEASIKNTFRYVVFS